MKPARTAHCLTKMLSLYTFVVNVMVGPKCTEMEELVKYSTDGNTYFCFIEVKNKCFPSVPKSTVKNWLRNLKIECKPCSAEEKLFFKDAIPSLSGSFGKISLADVQRLIEFSKRMRSRRQCDIPSSSTISKPPPVCSPNYSTSERPEESADSCMTNNFNNVQPEVSKRQLPSNNGASQPCCSSFMLELESQGTSDACGLMSSAGQSAIGASAATEVHLARAVAVVESDSDAQQKTIVDTTVTSPNNCSSASCAPLHEQSATVDSKPLKKGGKSRYTLPEEHITPELRKELQTMRSFYMSAPINPERQGPQLKDSTFDKIEERILGFLGFARARNPAVGLSLRLACDKDMIESFVDYLTKTRKLMASTVARILSVIQNVIQFVVRDKNDRENLPASISLTNMKRQLCREETYERKRKRESFDSPKGKEFFFGNIVDVLRQLREKFHNSSGLKCSRYLHDFTLLSLYIRALPGRCKEIRTLLLIDNSESDEPFSIRNDETLNALVFEYDGGIHLIESDFKTVRTTGPSRIELTDDEWLVYFLKLYAVEHRPALLLGHDHRYFFCNKTGDAFLGNGSLSKYLGDLFERECAIRASTTKMRHAIVTHFMNLPDSENIKLRESLASLMKHSVRHQQNTYNDQRRQSRVEMGRKFMRNAILDFDPSDTEEGDVEAIKSCSEQLSENVTDDTDLLPLIGQHCALLDPASTGPKNAFIFLAKVVRYTPDRKRVCLQELEKVSGSENLYRIKLSSTWWENVECLCFPIDIVFVASENAYHLRTTPEQIYRDIKSSK